MQDFINKNFFYLFIFAYLFGILFYNITGFHLIDEFCAVLLIIFFIYTVFHTKDWAVNKAFLFTLCVFIFYLFYSFRIHSNSPQGILMDFFIQLKPYLAFFCVYQMKPRLNENQQKILNHLSVVVWLVFLLPIGVLGFINIRMFKIIMDHPTNFASAVVATSLIYIFTSKYTTKDKLIFILLLSLGLISGRAKFYGFFVVTCGIIFYFNSAKRIKFNFKTLAGALVLCGIIFIVNKEKIDFYFLQGIQDIGGEDKKDSVARFALYLTSFSILKDYFPFGSGFGSFATYASGVHYSDIYAKYSIENIWGLSRAYTSFIADTYYPSLAQFGIAGVFLYIAFWIYLLKKTIRLNASQNLKYFCLIAAITVFLGIENIADATFTGHRGFFMMLMLGYIISNLYQDKKEEKSTALDE